MIGKQKAAGAGAKLAVGGILVSAALAGTAGVASAAPVHTRPATLSASGTGAHANWNGTDSVKLTVGSPMSSTFAQVKLANPPALAPATAPSFTTDNYAAGSPRWVIEFSSGCDLFGYPTGNTTFPAGALNTWSVNGATGCGHTATPYTTYALALAAAGSTQVTGAFIVADGDQTPGTTDTITDILYGGKGVAPEVTSHPTPPGHGHPTPPGHGHPTAPPGHGHPTTPPSGHNSRHGYVVNAYSGKCLDARNTFGRARTTELQLWSCGAARGEDQIFSYTDHTLRYDAKHGNDRYCVSEPRTGDRAMLLAPCDNEAAQYVTYDHGLYKYRDGRVLDDASFGTSDGNPVLTFAFNGGANQRWSLPK
jgi:Ricin-type beta-trefoil lectin domain